MSANSRTTVAIHALLLLAAAGDGWVRSSQIADSVNTNAVVIRRILARLEAAQLVQARRGARGGYRLARPAHRINLWDVYLALREASPFRMHAKRPNQRCPVGSCIQQRLGEIYAQTEQSMRSVLRRRTLRALLQSVAKA